MIIDTSTCSRDDLVAAMTAYLRRGAREFLSPAAGEEEVTDVARAHWDNDGDDFKADVDDHLAATTSKGEPT